MRKIQPLLLTLLCMFILFGASAKAETPPDLAASWQGEWGWESGPDDPGTGPVGGTSYPGHGNISIYDCKDATCAFVLESGDERSVCSAEGHIQLQSKTLAMFDSAYPAPQKQCHFELNVASGKINIANDSDGCSESCGHLGADFGSDYTKYTDRHYYAAGFECRKAKSKIEIAICSDKQLADLDRDLLLAFNTAKYKMNHADATTGVKALTDAQRAWVAKRNKDCGNAADIKACLEPLYTARIKEIGAP